MRRGASPRPGDKAAEPIRYGDLAGSIAFNLRRAHNMALQAFARELGPRHGRAGRFTLMTLIAENPGISQTALGRASGLDISTLTPSLNDLVRRGLVRRRRLAHDRRLYALNITPAGADFYREVARLANVFEARLVGIVGTTGVSRLLRSLKRIAAAFEEAGRG
jgi:DNA-binding MarR family transcriptional regulator